MGGGRAPKVGGQAAGGEGGAETRAKRAGRGRGRAVRAGETSAETVEGRER